MKLKFLHDSMRFNRETAREELIKKGQTVDIPDEDVNAFLAGTNPRAEIVSAKEKAAAYTKANVHKPIVKFIAKQTAPPKRQMKHASTIISKGSKKASNKIATMKTAKITMCTSPTNMNDKVHEQLEK